MQQKNKNNSRRRKRKRERERAKKAGKGTKTATKTQEKNAHTQTKIIANAIQQREPQSQHPQGRSRPVRMRSEIGDPSYPHHMSLFHALVSIPPPPPLPIKILPLPTQHTSNMSHHLCIASPSQQATRLWYVMKYVRFIRNTGTLPYLYCEHCPYHIE